MSSDSAHPTRVTLSIEALKAAIESVSFVEGEELLRCLGTRMSLLQEAGVRELANKFEELAQREFGKSAEDVLREAKGKRRGRPRLVKDDAPPAAVE